MSTIETAQSLERARNEMVANMSADAQEKSNNYKNFSLEDKSKYWIMYTYDFISNRVHLGGDKDKIDIKQIRETEEPQIDLFLQGMVIGALRHLFFDGKNSEEFLNKYFIFDEVAKKYLRTKTIEGVSIDNQTLANNIGNLFYSDLSGILSAIGIEVKKDGKEKEELIGEWSNGVSNGENIKEAGILIHQASLTIQEAWEICKDKPFPIEKHTPQVKGVDIPNIDLATNISKLDYPELGNFLLLLAEKIKNDGENDEQNGKIKLSTELLNASKKLEQSGKLLKTGVYS